MISFASKRTTTKPAGETKTTKTTKTTIKNEPTSSVIHFASKRKLIFSSSSGKPTEKRPKVEPIETKHEKPKEEIFSKTNYDSIGARLTRVIDEWILDVNADVIKKFLVAIRSLNRTCDVFCLIGPSGCGKSVVVREIIRKLQCHSFVYDEFADHGNRSVEGKHSSSTQGFLSKLMENANEFVFVIDGPDGDMHTDFQRQLINEYNIFQLYKRPNKSIVLLVQSLSSYTLRNWIRDIGACKYYLKDWMNRREQECLRQRVHSVVPLHSMHPIYEFAGDYRRMGIDLIACTHKGLQYHRNTNSVHKTPSIFDITRHLITWPMEPLQRPLLCGDNVDQLLSMTLHNQLFRTTTKFDEIAHVAQDLSDIAMITSLNDDTDKSLFIYPNNQNNKQPLVDCNRYDIFLLVQSLYASNVRLAQRNQLQFGKNVEIEFGRTFRVPVKSGARLSNSLDDLTLDRFSV